MFWKILNCDKLVYLPAHNNLKYIFPFIYIICSLRGINIHYLVVGGWLADYLKNKKLHVYLLKKIKVIFTETDLLKKNLEENYGFKNISKFPNIRIHNFIPSFQHKIDTFKIVFMARINKMKGLETIFNLAEYLEKYFSGKRSISIDFYGPIDNNDQEFFLNELTKNRNTQYLGTLEPDKIYNILERYDIMVLPTQYYTEGFPGSILDAYISGIPVVVTNWKHASEFVDHNETGFIVPFENGENDFINSVLKLYSDEELLKKMKYQAYQKSKEYSVESAWSIIFPFLEKNYNV
jgi:glycosyltransferase involved in cell wall biosynthesis